MFDLDHPGVLISGGFISLVGTALFIYGKKQGNIKTLATGAAYVILPMLVTSMLALWGIFGAGLGALWWFSREG